MGLLFKGITGISNTCLVGCDCEVHADISGEVKAGFLLAGGFSMNGYGDFGGTTGCNKYRSMTVNVPSDIPDQCTVSRFTYDITTEQSTADDDCFLAPQGSPISVGETKATFEGATPEDGRYDTVTLAGLISDQEYIAAVYEQMEGSEFTGIFDANEFSSHLLIDNDSFGSHTYSIRSSIYWLGCLSEAGSGVARTARADFLEIFVPHPVKKSSLPTEKNCWNYSINHEGITTTPKSAIIEFSPDETYKFTSTAFALTEGDYTKPGVRVIGTEGTPRATLEGSLLGRKLFRRGFPAASGENDEPTVLYKLQTQGGNEGNGTWLFKGVPETGQPEKKVDWNLDPTFVSENELNSPIQYGPVGYEWTGFNAPYNAIWSDSGILKEESQEWILDPIVLGLDDFLWSGSNGERLTVKLSEEYSVQAWNQVLTEEYLEPWATGDRTQYFRDFREGAGFNSPDYYDFKSPNIVWGGKARSRFKVIVSREDLYPPILDTDVNYEGDVVFFAYNPFSETTEGLEKKAEKKPFSVTIFSGLATGITNDFIEFTPLPDTYYEYSGIHIKRKSFDYQRVVNFKITMGAPQVGEIIF